MHELIKKLKDLGLKSIPNNQAYNPLQEFACRVSTKEIVHSIILADLMRPNDDHKLGYYFINAILHEVGLPRVSSTTTNEIEVATEYVLKGDRWDNRRIDILITYTIEKEVKRNYALIIENKLNDASYSDRQLEDYQEAIQTNYSADKVRILCLHRIMKPDDININNRIDGKILYAQDIAKLLDNAIKASNTTEGCYIKAYSRYLRNLATENGDYDNANILASDAVTQDLFNKLIHLLNCYRTELTENIDLSEEEKTFLDSMEIACNDSHNAFARRLIEEACNHKIDRADHGEQEAGYTNYAAIWNEEAYRNTGQWLSVGFENSTVYFFLVSHHENEENRNILAKNAGFYNPKYYARQGYYWYKPEQKLHTIPFHGKPNFEEVKQRIQELLNAINTSAVDGKH